MLRTSALAALALSVGLTAATPAGIPAALVRRTEIDICPDNPNVAVPDHHTFQLPLENMRQDQCFDFCIGDQATCAKLCYDFVSYAMTFDFPAFPGYTYSEADIWLSLSAPGGPVTPQYTTDNGKCTISGDKTTAHCVIPYSDIVGGSTKSDWLPAMCPNGDQQGLLFYLYTNAELLNVDNQSVSGKARSSCKDYPTCSENYDFTYWELTYRCTNCPPATTTTSSTTSTSSTTTSSTTSSEQPATTTTTQVVTYTTTTCPASRACHPVTCSSTVTATLIKTVTVPCETSTYVSQGNTIVTTITKPAITTYVTCPGNAPTYPTPASNATVALPTAAPLPTSTSGLSPFTGGSASLGISFGSLVALAALFAGLVL